MEYLKISKNTLICLTISIIGFIINFITYYPGFLSPDGIDQFTQALHNSYGDWHPPIMSGLWHILLFFYNGPQPMLFFQLVLLWSSFYFLLLIFRKNYGKFFWLIFIFIAAPFVQNFAGNIWKDVHMAFSWLLAISIMLLAYYNNRKMNFSEAIISILLLSYGCWVRINALPGLIPLIYLWLILLKTSDTKQNYVIIRLSIKSVAISAVIILAQIAITKTILNPYKNYSEYKLFAHDLSGIYAKTNKLYFPDFVKNYEGFDTLYLKQNYKYSTLDNIWWNSDGKTIFAGADDVKIKELRNSWLTAIAENPIVYLKNRTKGFLAFLRITNEDDSPLYTFYPYIHQNNFGFSVKPNALSKIVLSLLRSQSETFYMKPWFWLLINIFVFFFAFLKRFLFIKPLIILLSLSSLFYIGFEFLVFQIDTDFRYFYWNCISLFLLIIIICAEFLKPSFNHYDKITVLQEDNS